MRLGSSESPYLDVAISNAAKVRDSTLQLASEDEYTPKENWLSIGKNDDDDDDDDDDDAMD